MNRETGHVQAGSRRRVRADAGEDSHSCSRRSTRRTFILAAAAWPALAWAGAVLGQTKQAPITIGWLNTNSRESSGLYLTAFKEGLAALGWKEGSNFVLEERWADGQYDRLASLAEQLAAKKPAIFVAGPLQSVAAAAKAAPKTPIVQASGGDLLVAGLAASLARPGGMVTGLTNITGDISEKYLELLLEASPKLRRVGVLADPGNLNLPVLMETVRRSIAKRSVEARFAEATRPEEIEPAISRLAKEGAQGLLVIGSAMFRGELRRIVKLALAQRWPVVSGSGGWAEAGALLSYSSDTLAEYRRAAYYVDKILKGAKPADLPIEQPTKFELVINLKTAKAIGIKIPPSLLLQATRVIE
jgi:putative ABC transport system substrate-binding protein